MLLTLAYVVCCDETPIRVGPPKAKRYLLVAATNLLEDCAKVYPESALAPAASDVCAA
jgi:hypothetical protein